TGRRNRGPSTVPRPHRWKGRRPGTSSAGAPDRFADERWDLVGKPGHASPGRLQRGDLGLGRALSAGDDRARVPHPLPGGSAPPCDVRDDGLREVVADVLGRVLLGRSTDLSDHHEGIRVGVGFEEGQGVDERGPDDRVSPEADARGLAEAGLLDPADDLVGQGAAPRDDADAAGAEDHVRDDPDLGSPRGGDARAVRTDDTGPLRPRVVVHHQHVVEGDVLGDDDAETDPGVHRLEQRVPRVRCRNEDGGGVRVGRLDRAQDGMEHRDPFDLGPCLTRGAPGDHGGAEEPHLPSVDGPLVARDPLDDHPSVAVDENAHGRPRAASTAAWAEARRSEVDVIPAERRISVPSASLLPRILAIRGNRSFAGTSRIASTSPFATESQRVTPPKMLRKTAAGLARAMSRNASVTFFGSSVPPRSRNTPGAPPSSFRTSSVAIVSPAPFAMTPMLPSSWTNAISFSRATSSSSVRSPRTSAYSGWRNPASSSMITFASSATSPSPTTASGLISTSSASSCWKTFHRASNSRSSERAWVPARPRTLAARRFS